MVTATTAIYTLSLHDALPIFRDGKAYIFTGRSGAGKSTVASLSPEGSVLTDEISLLRREHGMWRAYGTPFWGELDRKSTRLNSSHITISYAVFCLKKKTQVALVVPLRGVPPFRACSQERTVVGATGKYWLFFLSQHEPGNYLYKEELDELILDGSL